MLYRWKIIFLNQLEVMNVLNERQKVILRCTIKQYVETAAPVGSKHLVKEYRLNFSPATIRNEMSNLEEMGYLSQPHISAGRVPTEKGYRVYVDALMKSGQLSQNEKKAVKQSIARAGGNLNKILGEASKIMSRISEELSVVITPWMSWGVFDRLELIRLTEGKLLAVIHVKSRLVKTVVLKIDSDINDDLLIEASSILNERLSGLTLEEIRMTIKERIRDVNRSYKYFLDEISGFSNELFDFSETKEVHYSGTSNILKQPEFSSVERIRPLFSLIDDKESLIRLFTSKTNDVDIKIGRENRKEELQPFTIVSASYKRGRDVGTLGVLGPIRMRYHKIIPLVNYVAKTMSKSLS